ncbi:ABC transporter permease [Vibrio sp. T187]|uniref:ABC transporter permease n=1 Tax=Vibrio TaxID=662 RepID=UPI0010CA1552|nr:MULTISPECIES: ABC transporter permease [Vibrio]MBW3694667.1 ABC transporter permease [Vibrio sp. T187]
MQDVVDISWFQLLLFSSILLIPLGISYYFKLGIAKEALVSILRMTIQLALVGVYLEYLFDLNSWWVNLSWLLIMVLIGANSIIGKAKLPQKPLLLPISFSLASTAIPLVILICALVIKPNPIFSAQYLIPIAGMLLGNCLSCNIVALQNLFGAFELRKSEYEGALSLGASPQYASAPFIRTAIQKSISPIMASMATTGIVTLPGMMTGQILGGASPMVAIKYQLMIMIAIFVMMACSLTLALHLSLKAAITKEGRVKVSFINKTS